MKKFDIFDGGQIPLEVMREIAHGWVRDALDAHTEARVAAADLIRTDDTPRVQQVGRSTLRITAESTAINALIETAVIPDQFSAGLVSEPERNYLDTVLAMLVEFAHLYEQSSSLTAGKLALGKVLDVDRTANEIFHMRNLAGDEDELDLYNLRGDYSTTTLLVTRAVNAMRWVVLRTEVIFIDTRPSDLVVS